MIITISLPVVLLFNDMKMTWMIKNLCGAELEFILILAILKRFTFKMYILNKIAGEILNLIQKSGYLQIKYVSQQSFVNDL